VQTGGTSFRNALLHKLQHSYVSTIAFVYPKNIHFKGRDLPCNDHNVEAIRAEISSPWTPSAVIMVGGHFGYNWLQFGDGTIAADETFRTDPYAQGKQVKPWKPFLPATHVVQ
jgi:hypothetical protein